MRAWMRSQCGVKRSFSTLCVQWGATYMLSPCDAVLLCRHTLCHCDDSLLCTHYCDTRAVTRLSHTRLSLTTLYSKQSNIIHMIFNRYSTVCIVFLLRIERGRMSGLQCRADGSIQLWMPYCLYPMRSIVICTVCPYMRHAMMVSAAVTPHTPHGARERCTYSCCCT